MSRKTERPQPDQEYDHMSLDVKRGKAEKFRRSCEDFGWQQVERRADRRYADIVHLRFRRPHAIANKDALQLLQVRLEIAWNTIGRCESALSARTAAFAVVGGIAAACLLAAGVTLLCLFWPALWAKAAGGALGCVGALGCIGALLLCRRIFGKNRRACRENIEAARAQIGRLCAQARALRSAAEGEEVAAEPSAAEGEEVAVEPSAVCGEEVAAEPSAVCGEEVSAKPSADAGASPSGRPARGEEESLRGEEASPHGEEASPRREEASPRGEEASPRGEEESLHRKEASPQGGEDHA